MRDQTVSAEQDIDAVLTVASLVSVGKVVPPDRAESLYAARRLSGHLYARVLLVRCGGQRVSMPATTQGDRGPLQAVQPKGREEGVRKVLLVCGSLSGLVYLGSHEPAALQRDGYSRVSNAISELSHDRLTVEMDGWIYKALVIPFGDRRKA